MRVSLTFFHRQLFGCCSLVLVAFVSDVQHLERRNRLIPRTFVSRILKSLVFLEVLLLHTYMLRCSLVLPAGSLAG